MRIFLIFSFAPSTSWEKRNSSFTHIVASNILTELIFSSVIKYTKVIPNYIKMTSLLVGRCDILNSNSKYRKWTYEKGLVAISSQMISIKSWIDKDYIIQFSSKSKTGKVFLSMQELLHFKGFKFFYFFIKPLEFIWYPFS